MLARLRPVFDRLFVVSLVATAIGIILVMLAEFAEVHEARIFGATLIVLGGTGIGTATGLADPRSFRVPAWLVSWRVAIALGSAVLVVAPVAVVLLVALVGLVADAEVDRSTTWLLVGALIAIFFLAAVVLSAVESGRRIVRAGHEPPSRMTSDEVVEESNS